MTKDDNIFFGNGFFVFLYSKALFYLCKAKIECWILLSDVQESTNGW